MNHFSLITLFRCDMYGMLRVKYAFWISQLAQSNTYTLFLFVCLFCCETKCVEGRGGSFWIKLSFYAFGFIEDVDSLLPLGINVGFLEHESVSAG